MEPASPGLLLTSLELCNGKTVCSTADQRTTVEKLGFPRQLSHLMNDNLSDGKDEKPACVYHDGGGFCLLN